MAADNNKEYHVTDCLVGLSKNIASNKDKFLISIKPATTGGNEKKTYTIDKSNTIKRIFLDSV